MQQLYQQTNVRPAIKPKTYINYLSIPGTLLIIDTLHPLAISPTHPLPTFLSTILTPTTSLLATYHTDIPLPPSPTNPYAPSPLTNLKYLATTIFTTHSFDQVLARKRAADKSQPEPVFGLAEEKDGVLVGMGANGCKRLVVEMEHRRKSGRGVEETFFVPGVEAKEKIVLLDDHPAFRREEVRDGKVGGEGGEEVLSTFDLGITERQRRDREGVVLPYFDAQSGEGGVGGRILYDMGAEDDFDDEEDEI